MKQCFVRSRGNEEESEEEVEGLGRGPGEREGKRGGNPSSFIQSRAVFPSPFRKEEAMEWTTTTSRSLFLTLSHPQRDNRNVEPRPTVDVVGDGRRHASHATHRRVVAQCMSSSSSSGVAHAFTCQRSVFFSISSWRTTSSSSAAATFCITFPNIPKITREPRHVRRRRREQKRRHAVRARALGSHVTDTMVTTVNPTDPHAQSTPALSLSSKKAYK